VNVQSGRCLNSDEEVHLLLATPPVPDKSADHPVAGQDGRGSLEGRLGHVGLKRVGRELRMLVENSDDQTAADPSLPAASRAFASSIARA
jgi:hypothetical protein